MISRQDIQKLIHRPEGELPILSVFLDMSVNSDNKRTYSVFLSQRRGQYAELDSDRDKHHREALGEAFERVGKWLDEQFTEVNKGVAVYTEIGGEWIDGFQFPVPVRNRTEIASRPIVGPLAQVIEGNLRHGVVVLDREKMRMILVDLGFPAVEHEVQGAAYPSPNDVKAGGEAAKGYQKWKAEEVRHFFKTFGLELAEFDRRYRPDDLIVLGTDKTVKHFVDLLPQALADKVVHIDRARYGETWAEILERLAPFFLEQHAKTETGAVTLLQERVGQQHLAIAGFPDTLEQLQEGRVDTLVLARDIERPGALCVQCGFYLARLDSTCPYCGGGVERGVDLVEAMIRMAEEQEVALEFVAPEAITHLNGVGALLKF